MVWDKRLAPNDSFAVSKVQWDCKNKSRLTLEMTMYESNQTVIGTTKKFEWQSVITGTVGDIMFKQICSEKPKPQFVEIVTDETPLLALPIDKAPNLKTAKKGIRFLLVSDDSSIWYNIVDEKTQQDYWVRNNAVKIIENEATKKKKDK